MSDGNSSMKNTNKHPTWKNGWFHLILYKRVRLKEWMAATALFK